MRITVYNCTQKSLIGYHADVNYLDLKKILDNKHGELVKEDHTYHYDFDTIIRIGPKRFIIINPNMSIWCKVDQKIPENAFGNRSFVVNREKNI